MKENKFEIKDLDSPIINHSIFIRGNVINAVSNLEGCMNIFLSYHFSRIESKANELNELVFATKHLTFDGKRDIINSILKKHHAKFLADNKTFNKDLQKIAENRNVFAHYQTSHQLGSKLNFVLDNSIYFVQHQRSNKSLKFDIKELVDFVGLINKYIEIFCKLVEDMHTPSP